MNENDVVARILCAARLPAPVSAMLASSAVARARSADAEPFPRAGGAPR